MKTCNFGQMMVEIAKNTDILNDTNKKLHLGIFSAKANDERQPLVGFSYEWTPEGMVMGYNEGRIEDSD
jgi:hypothetical protein